MTRGDLEASIRVAARAADGIPECQLAADLLGYLWRRLVLTVAWDTYAAARGLPLSGAGDAGDAGRGPLPNESGS